MNTKKVSQIKNQITDDLTTLKGKINRLEDSIKAKIEVAKSYKD